MTPERDPDDPRESLPDPWLELAVVEALEAAPRLSPAARRFLAGRMDAEQARELGYTR